jgi:hypothetical protein
MNPPQSGTSLTEDAVQTIGGRNTRGDKSDSPGRRNEIFASAPTLSVELCPVPVPPPVFAGGVFRSMHPEIGFVPPHRLCPDPRPPTPTLKNTS